MKTFTHIGVVIVAACGLAYVPSCVVAANAVLEFSTVSNPFGPWRYEGAESGGAAGGDNNYVLFPTPHTSVTWGGAGWHSPGWSEDYEGIFLTGGGTALTAHPASIGGVGHTGRIGYVVPATGLYDIDASVLKIQGFGDAEMRLAYGSVGADSGSLTVLDSLTILGGGPPMTFNSSENNVSLTAGQAVYLEFAQLAFGGDGVRIDIFTITASVPEPTTLTLAALGLASLGFVTWKKKHRRN